MENKIKNSEEFLNSVTNKSTGFSTPKNYFSSVEDKFSTFLIEDKLPKENGFTTPTNYFNNLEDVILKNTSPKKEVKVISLKSRILKYIPIAAAASVALFLSINYSSIFNTEVSFDNLAESDIESWVMDNSNELSDQDFAALLSNEIANENDFALTDINSDAIEDYIIYSEDTSTINENY